MSRRWWAPCDDYTQVLNRFGRIDVLIALGALVLNAGFYLWQGWLRSSRDLGFNETLWLSLADLALVILLVLVILRVRSQPLAAAGLSRTHLGHSIVFGLLLTVAGFLLLRVLGSFDGEVAPYHPRWLTFALPYYLLGIGLAEEILFRGLVTTRLAAAFRRRWIGVVLAGVLFSLSHIPFQLGLNNFDLDAVLPDLVWMLPITFGWHLVLWWLYARFNSLAAPTLVHLLINTGSLVM